MKKSFVIIMILSILLLSSCSGAKSAVPGVLDRTANEGGAPMTSSAPMMPAPAAIEKDLAGESYASSSVSQAADRIVIKNADLSIVVPDPAASLTTIASMAEEMGGFVVTSNLFKTTSESGIELPEANITVRVPVVELTNAINQIKSLVGDPKNDVLSENVNGQDVTREYTDLKSRLGNLENAEARLKEIMASAKETQDVLAVYNQLTQITEQIEVLKGQIKYYDESSALSAISVRLQSKEAIKPLTIGGWQPAGIARDAIQLLINSLKGLANILIYLVLFCLPVGALVAIPGYFIFKGFRQWQLRRKAAKAAQQTTETPQ